MKRNVIVVTLLCRCCALTSLLAKNSVDAATEMEIHRYLFIKRVINESEYIKLEPDSDGFVE